MIAQPPLFEIELARAPLDLRAAPRTLRDFARPAYAPGANSALAAFVRAHALAPAEYTLKPLPEELVAGKNTYVYDAHTYHTKVPPQAIARLIEYYAAPGGLRHLDKCTPLAYIEEAKGDECSSSKLRP